MLSSYPAFLLTMLFPYLTRNVWLLCLAQVFAFTGTNVTIFLGGI